MNLDIVPNPIPDFDVRQVLQIRHIVRKAELPEEYGAQTTIEIGQHARYVMQSPEQIADIINAERMACGLKPMIVLSLPGGKPVWVAGEGASGPVALIRGEIVDGVRSAFAVGDLLTRVRNTPQEVADAIGGAGGEVRPIPDSYA